jgi:hypothetical protein
MNVLWSKLTAVAAGTAILLAGAGVAYAVGTPAPEDTPVHAATHEDKSKGHGKNHEAHQRHMERFGHTGTEAEHAEHTRHGKPDQHAFDHANHHARLTEKFPAGGVDRSAKNHHSSKGHHGDQGGQDADE